MSLLVHVCPEMQNQDGYWQPIVRKSGSTEYMLGDDREIALQRFVILSSRKQALKAILCGEENFFINDDERFCPVDSPRGLPGGLSDKYQKLITFLPIRSPTFYAMKELISFPWETQDVIYSVQMEEKDFRDYVVSDQHCNYFRGFHGTKSIHVSAEHMKKIFAGEAPRVKGARYIVNVEWKWNYRQAIGEDFFYFLQDLPKFFGKKKAVLPPVRLFCFVAPSLEYLDAKLLL